MTASRQAWEVSLLRSVDLSDCVGSLRSIVALVDDQGRCVRLSAGARAFFDVGEDEPSLEDLCGPRPA